MSMFSEDFFSRRCYRNWSSFTIVAFEMFLFCVSLLINGRADGETREHIQIVRKSEYVGYNKLVIRKQF